MTTRYLLISQRWWYDFTWIPKSEIDMMTIWIIVFIWPRCNWIINHLIAALMCVDVLLHHYLLTSLIQAEHISVSAQRYRNEDFPDLVESGSPASRWWRRWRTTWRLAGRRTAGPENKQRSRLNSSLPCCALTDFPHRMSSSFRSYLRTGATQLTTDHFNRLFIRRQTLVVIK